MVFANNGQISRVVQHIHQPLGRQEALPDKHGIGRIPEGIFVLTDFGYHSGFVVLLQQVLDDEVPVGELAQIPEVAIAELPIIHLHLNVHLVGLCFGVLVEQQHLYIHKDIALELLGDEVEFDHLRKSLG